MIKVHFKQLSAGSDPHRGQQFYVKLPMNCDSRNQPRPQIQTAICAGPIEALMNLVLLILVACCCGFNTAGDRNAGRVLDGCRSSRFPLTVIGEAIERGHLLPGYMAKYLLPLIET